MTSSTRPEPSQRSPRVKSPTIALGVVVALDYDHSNGSPTEEVLRMARRRWRVIGYRVPTPPSRNRLAVRRGLRRLGAVNAPQSARILPYGLWNRADLKKMSDDIETWDGESRLIASMILEERRERRAEAFLPAGEERPGAGCGSDGVGARERAGGGQYGR